jgi:CubicO group peptidase (beta-lactamase class C family)
MRAILLGCLVSLVIGPSAAARPPTTPEGTATEPDLRLTEPLDAVVHDLETFIPGYIAEKRVPGAAIALIRDGEVVWTSGFGVANTITAEPVTSDTLFEVASNTKVISSYLALRLVDQGVLDLDRPLDDYLSEPFLPQAGYRGAVTLRHVLSHSSGLGHTTLSRELLFPPGRGYSYSGLGFLYLKRVLDEVTGRSLDELGEELVFEPLGMRSSSYVNEARELTVRTANGHLRAAVPTAFFLLLYLVALFVAGLIGFMVLRVRTGRWRPGTRQVVGTLIAALALSLALTFVLLGVVGLWEFAWIIAFVGLGLAAAFGLLLAAGRSVLRMMFAGRRRWRIAMVAVWTLVVFVGLGLLVVGVRNLPVPRWPPVPADAAGSVRATAGDMATFLIELSDPVLLEEETAAQLRTPQIRLSDDLSWGLGPGIQHSRQGDALWQWGQHVDFQSLMILYPRHGLGVVVLTNSDLLDPDVAIPIAHRAIGGKMEPIRRASHLEFNYRQPLKTAGTTEQDAIIESFNGRLSG